ncbi:MAG: hypothetical protein ACLPWG_13830 [Steroidobacteraceae bacterium]
MTVFNSLRYMTVVAALTMTGAPACSMRGAESASDAVQEAWVVQASAGLPPPILDTLHRIVGADRRLLALRAYLRAGGALSERWSWSQEQLSAYAETPQGKAAAIHINAVAVAFTAVNPGFTLQVNQQPRSLELQISHWNENGSVGTSAAALVHAIDRRFTATRTPPTGDELRRMLMQWPTDGTVALAAPGLSAHGQGHAYDFQVVQHGQVIAGTNVASAHRQWDAAGWTQKLHAAVSVAGNHFVGPLESPYEPWHYAYSPVPMILDRKTQ